MAQMTMIQAITDAMRNELKKDENVLIFGEDVGKNGGVFGRQTAYRLNSGKTGYSILRLLNQVSAV